MPDWFHELFINEAKPALNRHSGGNSGGVTFPEGATVLQIVTDEPKNTSFGATGLSANISYNTQFTIFYRKAVFGGSGSWDVSPAGTAEISCNSDLAQYSVLLGKYISQGSPGPCYYIPTDATFEIVSEDVGYGITKDFLYCNRAQRVTVKQVEV